MKLPDQDKLPEIEFTTQKLSDADYFLAEIIYPVICYIERHKDAAPEVDDEDVPENLRRSEEDLAELEEYPGYIDTNYFDRWSYVVSTIKNAFHIINQVGNGTYFVEENMYNYDHIPEVKEGLRLFAKYYSNLWV